MTDKFTISGQKLSDEEREVIKKVQNEQWHSRKEIKDAIGKIQYESPAAEAFNFTSEFVSHRYELVEKLSDEYPEKGFETVESVVHNVFENTTESSNLDEASRIAKDLLEAGFGEEGVALLDLMIENGLKSASREGVTVYFLDGKINYERDMHHVALDAPTTERVMSFFEDDSDPRAAAFKEHEGMIDYFGSSRLSTNTGGNTSDTTGNSTITGKFTSWWPLDNDD